VEVLEDDIASFDLEWSSLIVSSSDPLDSERIRVVNELKLVRRGLGLSARISRIVFYGNVDLHPTIAWLWYLLLGASSSPAICSLEDLACWNLVAVLLEANVVIGRLQRSSKWSIGPWRLIDPVQLLMLFH
jgi:hypothetical protein